jgi:hypothetical protein
MEQDLATYKFTFCNLHGEGTFSPIIENIRPFLFSKFDKIHKHPFVALILSLHSKKG